MSLDTNLRPPPDTFHLELMVETVTDMAWKISGGAGPGVMDSMSF